MNCYRYFIQVKIRQSCSSHQIRKPTGDILSLIHILLGTQADVAYACLDETGSVEQFEKTVIHQLNEVWGQDEVLVLADMMNGTPSRVAAQLISQRSCKGLILCGMNLNVLLEAYMLSLIHIFCRQSCRNCAQKL